MDIVTWCNVPRYLHNDLPLGNPLGEPDDRVNQRRSVVNALGLIESMSEPGVTVSDLAWQGDSQWKSVYGRVGEDNRAQLLKMGEENRRARAENKAKGLIR